MQQVVSVRHLLREASRRRKEEQHEQVQRELTVDINNSLPRPERCDMHKVRNGPNAVHVLPEFIEQHEERDIVQAIISAPQNKWQKLRHRRLQMWGGSPDEGIPENIPMYLEQIIDLVSPMFPPDRRPNHILINEYLPEQFIMPHKDGPLYYPLVAILSLNADAVFKFQFPVDSKHDIEYPEINVPRRSLLVFSDEAYHELLHSATNHSDTTRYSITIRFVNMDKNSN
jgi:alkylated DNA repair dioxygenase AlkB